MNTDTSEPNLIARPFLRRVEQLTRRLLGVQFKDVSDLWKFEVELIKLQRDIQVAINRFKKLSKQDKTKLGVLRDLRYARGHAKRLGDAFAWLVFGLNRKIIFPLSENARTPISQEDHGSRGMMVIATHLASSGWGFPVIHDATDCLRIGDITFVTLSTDSPRVYRTVEIKTNLKSEKREKVDNLTHYEYEIRVVSSVPFDPATGAQIDPEELKDKTVYPPSAEVARRPDRRVNRQVRRMSKALRHQTAPDNRLIEIDGEVPLLSTIMEDSVSSYWKSLRRVIRLARRDGYASECVEGSFLYAAFYQATGITEDSIRDIRLLEDIQESGILIVDGSHPNALLINAVPPQEQAVAHSFLPYYLYSIPRRAVYDLVHGRLVIVVIVSQGRILQALEEAGFTVNLKPGSADNSFTVAKTIVTSSGTNYRIDLPSLFQYMNEMVYEFHGLDYLTGIAKSISEAAADVLIRDP